MTQTPALPDSAFATPDQHYDRYRAIKHFGSLNGLRFVCIFAVLWHHAPIWIALEDPARLLTRGFMGVDFFFVLSGFLITTLLQREEARDGSFSLRGFYWRRTLRIFPVYFLVVSAVAAYYIGVKGRSDLWELVPFYYLFLANFLTSDISLLTPTWPLSVEEQYYLIWPLMLLLTPRRMVLYVLAGLIALNVVAVTGGLAVFGIGSALAVVLHRRPGFDMVFRLLGTRGASLVMFVLLGVLLNTLPQDVTGWPGLVLHLTMVGCLASIVLREDHLLAGLFALRPSRGWARSAMGSISIT